MKTDKELTDMKRAFVEAQIAELKKIIPGVVLLTNQNEVNDISFLVQKMLEDSWDAGQRPMREALQAMYK